MIKDTLPETLSCISVDVWGKTLTPSRPARQVPSLLTASNSSLVSFIFLCPPTALLQLYYCLTALLLSINTLRRYHNDPSTQPTTLSKTATATALLSLFLCLVLFRKNKLELLTFTRGNRSAEGESRCIDDCLVTYRPAPAHHRSRQLETQHQHIHPENELSH